MAIPSVLDTVIFPEVVPGGTTAVTTLSETTVKVETSIPLNLNVLELVNPDPINVMVLPIFPERGKTEVMTGG